MRNHAAPPDGSGNKVVKLLRYLKPYSASVAAVFGLTFLHSIAELLLPTLLAAIVDTGIVNGNVPYILQRGGIMLLVALGGAACIITGNYLSSRVALGFGADLRSSIFEHVESFSLPEFDRIGTASLITRTTNDITQIQMVAVIVLRMMIGAPLMCIGGIIMALSRDVQLSKVLLVIIPFLGLAATFAASRVIPLFRTMQRKLDRLNLVLRENLTGVRVVRAFNRTQQEQKRFDRANEELTATAIKVNKIMAAIMPAMMISLNFTAIAVIWFGGLRIDAGQMQLGDLIAFLQYIMLIMFSLIMVSMMFIMLPRASVSADRINEVLAIVPGITDPAAAVTAKGAAKGLVELKEVAFSYPGAEQPVLSGITFSAAPGEVTAIIGGTGSGKTTLVNLLPRFYDVSSGAICIDGVDLRQMTQAELRAKIGLVPQKAFLFSGSVADNIRFGLEEATDEEIRKAAAIAQAGGFIEELPGGFDAPIAQGGANLSGGQKQRLAIARALVRRPRIFIFDDSFSALDFKTDARLRAALKEETGAATVFIVAQRVSTIMDADRIVVLESGKIAGMGTHKELLNSCPVYREIVLSQLAEEEIA